MDKIAIIHTTPVTVGTFAALVKEHLPKVEVINFLDDSILPMLLEDEGSIEYAYEKLLCYATFAQRQGVKLILNACSSVGEFKAYAQDKLSVPLVRIDDPVSSLAVEKGKKIAVLATLRTTLKPSCHLLEAKGKGDCQITPVLVEGAYSLIKSGDREGHHRLIAKAIEELAPDYDVIYLAQASMAEAMEYGVTAENKDKALFSTMPVINELARVLKAEAGECVGKI